MNKSKLVKDFFDNSDVYLNNNSNIMLRKNIIRKIIRKPENLYILDIGCGDGSLSSQFLGNGNNITLLDISSNMLDKAKQNIPIELLPSVRFINGDFLEHEFNETYDIIICVGVLAHVDSVYKTIEKISSLLKPGGRCILQLTNYSNIIGKILIGYYWLISTLKQEETYFVNKVRLKKIINDAKTLNLIPIDFIYYFSILPGMGLLNPEKRYKFQQFSVTNKFLSRLGSEVVLQLIKQGKS